MILWNYGLFLNKSPLQIAIELENIDIIKLLLSIDTLDMNQKSVENMFLFNYVFQKIFLIRFKKISFYKINIIIFHII